MMMFPKKPVFEIMYTVLNTPQGKVFQKVIDGNVPFDFKILCYGTKSGKDKIDNFYIVSINVQ